MNKYDDLRIPKSNRTVLLSDSIGLGQGVYRAKRDTALTLAQGNSVGYDFMAWADLLSSGKIIYDYNASMGGEVSAGGLYRVDADVVSRNPGCCVISLGQNDAALFVSLTAYSANIQKIVQKLRGAQILPVLCTISPRATDAVLQRQLVSKYNVWLRYYAHREGIPLVDWNPAITDTTTGALKASMVGDGLHPGTYGAKAMGQALADTLGPLLNAWSPTLAVTQHADFPNMIPGGLFLTNSAGVGTGWNPIPGTGVSFSVVADAAIVGNWQRLTTVSTTANGNIYSNPIAVTAGNRLSITGRVEATGVDGGGTLSLALLFDSGELFYPIRYPNSVLEEGVEAYTSKVFQREFVVPAAATSVTAYIGSGFRTVATSRYIQFAQLTMLDLTARGVDDI